MAIYSPDIQLSKRDIFIIRELALLLANDKNLDLSKDIVLQNTPILISHEQALSLLKYLREKLSDFVFKQQIEFSERVIRDVPNSKQIYKYLNRKRLKVSLGLNHNFDLFRFRLGIPISWSHAIGPPPKQMNYDHFIKMEKKLFDTLKIHPSVKSLLLELLYLEQSKIDNLRFQRIDDIKSVRISQFIEKIIDSLAEGTEKRANFLPLGSLNLCSLIGILSNTGVLITTRDWGVTGTISTMANFSLSIRK